MHKKEGENENEKIRKSTAKLSAPVGAGGSYSQASFHSADSQ